jgi:hypothetical protein
MLPNLQKFRTGHPDEIFQCFWSVSRFQEKEKRGEMITKNDNIE